MHERTAGSPTRRWLALLAIAWLTTACSTRAPVLPSEAERHPVRVAVIPVLAAEEVSLDRSFLGSQRYGAIGSVVDRVDLKRQREVFQQMFTPARQWIGPEITEALRAASVRRGIDTVVLTDIVRNPEDPDDFDYRQVATDADVVVHARVRTLGLYATASAFEPNLEVSVVIVGRRTGAVLLDENFSYGAKAKERATWSVFADDRFRFAEFDDVLARVALVNESWHAGATAVGRRIAEQLGRPLAR